MAIDTNVQTFTDTELLNLTREQIAKIMVSGQAYDTNGRSLTRANLDALWNTVRILEARINAADDTGSIALGAFQDPA